MTYTPIATSTSASTKRVVAHGQRGLHHLGGDAAGELVLVEGHALAEHQAVEVPAQPHRES
jgi:hypothetical protein